MVGLIELNRKLDHFWDDYNKRFPGLFYIDAQGRRSMPLIVAGKTLRSDHAPLYLRDVVDQDPTSWYMLVAANPLTGKPCDHDTAVEFFHDFFYVKLGQKSSYDATSRYHPTPENPEFGTMDEWAACNKEVLPNAQVSQQKYDEIMNGGKHEMTPEEKAARIEKLGFDPDDGKTIDIDVDAPAAPAQAAAPAPTPSTTDITEYVNGNKYEISFANKICYAVDLHMPSTDVEIGYDGRGGNRIGGRRTGRLGRGSMGRLGMRESENKGKVMAIAEVGKAIQDLLKKNPWGAEFAEDVKLYVSDGGSGIDFPVTSVELGYESAPVLKLITGRRGQKSTVTIVDLAKAKGDTPISKFATIQATTPEGTYPVVVSVADSYDGIRFTMAEKDNAGTSLDDPSLQSSFNEKENVGKVMTPAEVEKAIKDLLKENPWYAEQPEDVDIYATFHADEIDYPFPVTDSRNEDGKWIMSARPQGLFDATSSDELTLGLGVSVDELTDVKVIFPGEKTGFPVIDVKAGQDGVVLLCKKPTSMGESVLDDVWNGDARNSGEEQEDPDEGLGNYSATDEFVTVPGIGKVYIADITDDEYEDVLELREFRGKKLSPSLAKQIVAAFSKRQDDADDIRGAVGDDDAPDYPEDEDNLFESQSKINYWNSLING